MKRVTVLLLLLALALTGACSKKKKETKAGTSATTATTAKVETTTAANQTLTVNVDGKAPKFNAAFLAYFPNQVTVRPGDTINFKENWTGEPHSVTMGMLIDQTIPAAKQAGPNGKPPAAFENLPVMLPEGPGDANQGAAQPCFLTTGSPPKQGPQACPKAAQPDFNGKQAYYSSGFLPEGKTFAVKLADDIAPGTYNYYCNLHGPDMSGTITVQAKGAAIPTAKSVEDQGTAQRDTLISKVQPAYDGAKAGKSPIPGNLAGFGLPDDHTALVNEFIPQTINAKVGEKVTWSVLGPHTISFNAPADAGPPPVIVAPDGAVHVNPKALAPTNSPAPPPPPNGPPSQKPVVVDGGSYDGAAFKSSGFFAPGPTQYQYAVTFTKAGTYNYKCLIHPGMDGVVKVA